MTTSDRFVLENFSNYKPNLITMEKSLNFLSITFLISFLSINTLSGQDETKQNIQKLIKLNNESEVKEVLIPIQDSVKSLMILVSSNIQAGDVTIEIYDPVGEKHGYFSIGCQPVLTNKTSNPSGKSTYTTNADRASGNLSRTVKNPVKGDWKLKIIPKNASGTVNLNFSLNAFSHTYIKLK